MINILSLLKGFINQLKILIPVGIAIIIVADVKYALRSASKPTIYIWCDHTKNPNKPIDAIAYTIEISPNTGFLEYVDTICDTIPNPGIIKI